MPDDILFSLNQEVRGLSPDKKIYGVTLATVLSNTDTTSQGRVQLMLPWMPGFQPWARVAVLMAGMMRGTYFIPQVGDEVLVAFNHGDVREPYVIGCLWNMMDRPPASLPTDPMTKRMIRTPLGHELTFDETEQSVTLTSNTKSTVTLSIEKAEISTPTAKVSVSKKGDVTITAATKLTLDAPIIEIKAKTLLSLKSQGPAALKSSAACVVQGSVVKIN